MRQRAVLTLVQSEGAAWGRSPPTLSERTESSTMASLEQQPNVRKASETTGFPWQFRLVMIVIAAGVLMIVAKVLGLF